MGWELASNWVTVAGLSLVVTATGLQAWANIREYSDLFLTMSPTAQQALMTNLASELTETVGGITSAGALVAFLFRYARPLLLAAVRVPGKMAVIREAGGNDAVRLAQLLRQAAAWAILMAGSVLVLSGAIITLILLYKQPSNASH